MKLSTVLPAVVLLLSNSLAVAQPSGPSLTSITLNSGTNFIGEVRSENAATLVLFDLNTGDEKTIKIADIKTRNPATDTAAIGRVGLPRLLAWRVKKELNGPATGKIAEVTPSSIYLTLGSKDGIEVGNTLNVFRDEGELKDPDTGNVIGRKRAKLARLEVTEVQDSYSKAKRLGDTDVELKAKDEVEQEGVNLAVAIMPILDIEGDETTTGKTLAEQISTVFVSRGITVVERERLTVALTELALQQSKAFDANAAQKVGKQLGAVAVLTGTITPKGTRAEAHVRLIRVQTGEAIVAASQDIAAVGNKVAGVPQPAVPGAGVAAPKIDPLLLRKKFSAGRAVFDAKTGQLTLTYDFKTPAQLKDFELNEAMPAMANGILRIGPSDNIQHVAKFKSVSVGGYFKMENIKDDRPLLSTSSGLSLKYNHFNELWFRIMDGPREIGKRATDARGPWPRPILFEASEKKVLATIGKLQVGATIDTNGAGTVSFHGGTGGVLISTLVISGIPDDDWLREFLAP